MAITFNNGPANIQGTPGFATGLFSSAPAASEVATGTIWFDNINGTIHQSNGISWDSLGGGGGGTSGIDTVLSVNQALTTDRSIQCGNFLLDIYNFKTLQLVSANTTQLFLLDDNIYTKDFSGNNYGYNLEFVTNKYTFGNCDTINNYEPKLYIDYNSTSFFSANNTGVFLEKNEGKTIIGDYNGQGNRVKFVLNDVGYAAVLENGNIENGLNVNFDQSIYYFGDFAAQNTETYIGVDASNENIKLSTQNIELTDNGSGLLLSNSAGGNSGQHLVIKIDGNTYKISLLNP
jgi:hypothetical protein